VGWVYAQKPKRSPKFHKCRHKELTTCCERRRDGCPDRKFKVEEGIRRGNPSCQKNLQWNGRCFSSKIRNSRCKIKCRGFEGCVWPDILSDSFQNCTARFCKRLNRRVILPSLTNISTVNTIVGRVDCVANWNQSQRNCARRGFQTLCLSYGCEKLFGGLCSKSGRRRCWNSDWRRRKQHQTLS